MFIIRYCHSKLATRCHWYNFYVYVNRVKHDSFHFTMFILHWFCLLSKAFESFTNNWKSWYSKRIVKWMYRNLNQSWILLKDKKQQADMLCKQQFQINHPFHMVLTFPSPPTWQSNSASHCWPSVSNSWPQYLQIPLLSHSLFSLLLCCVVNRHSAKKETLRKTEFLLLLSLLFSQFWKLDIKQVNMRDQYKYAYLHKNLDCLNK